MATTATLVKSFEDHDLTLVSAHQRALAGEAGSDYKPISVREHLRRVFHSGDVERVDPGFKWQPGCFSLELMDEMQQVLKLGLTKKVLSLIHI